MKPTYCRECKFYGVIQSAGSGSRMPICEKYPGTVTSFFGVPAWCEVGESRQEQEQPELFVEKEMQNER